MATSFKPLSELDIDYINTDSRVFDDNNKRYFFEVAPNRRYNVYYIRDRNVEFLKDSNNKDIKEQYLASGLPSRSAHFYKTLTAPVTTENSSWVLPAQNNPLQFPELRYSFDVLDVSTAAGTIDVVRPTPVEYAYKYNCYDYLLKAFYSTGNYKEGDPLPFTMTDEVRQRLQQSVIYESQNLGETLYDVLMYVGRYLHAIPHCYIGDGDLLYLDFLQLGKGETSPNSGRVISIYNSRNLAEYISSFDSYVTNLTNNDSEIEEIINVLVYNGCIT